MSETSPVTAPPSETLAPPDPFIGRVIVVGLVVVAVIYSVGLLVLVGMERTIPGELWAVAPISVTALGTLATTRSYGGSRRRRSTSS